MGRLILEMESRQRMIRQTYSKQWVPAHPGASPDKRSVAALSYAPPTVDCRRAPSHTSQDTMASTLNLQHPTATQADRNSLPLPPQSFVPDLAASSATQTAGNQRERLSEHWTRKFDDSIRPDAPANRESRMMRDAYIFRDHLTAADDSACRQRQFSESHGFEVQDGEAGYGSNLMAPKQSYVAGSVHQMVMKQMASKIKTESPRASAPLQAICDILDVDTGAAADEEGKTGETSKVDADGLWPASAVRPTLEATLSSLPHTQWQSREGEQQPVDCADEHADEQCESQLDELEISVDNTLHDLSSKLLMMSMRR